MFWHRNTFWFFKHFDKLPKLFKCSSNVGLIVTVFGSRCRDGHVKFWRVPRLVPSLRHLCRATLRYSVSTFQVQALPLPKKILDFLTYRDIAKRKILRCSKHYSWWGAFGWWLLCEAGFLSKLRQYGEKKDGKTCKERTLVKKYNFI